MITYSSMTFREAIHEILLRATQLRIAANLDGEHVRNFLCSARREIMGTAVPYKDWMFIAQPFAVSDGIELPQDFVAPVRVQLKDNLSTTYTDAQKVDVREWLRFTASVGAHSWNQATTYQPKYMLWGASDAADEDWANKGVIIRCAPTGVSGYIEYYASYNNVSGNSDTLNVPYEYENLVIMSALVRVAMKIGEADKLGDTYNQYQTALAKLQRKAIARYQSEAINLESQTSRQPTAIQTTVLGG